MLTKSNIHTVPSGIKNYEGLPATPHYFNLFTHSKKPNAALPKKEKYYLSGDKMKLVYCLLQIIIAMTFVIAGMTPWISDIPVYLFSSHSGIPVSFLYVVSIIAMLLALIQLVPVTSFAAQLGLTLMSIAIAIVHLIIGSPLQFLLPAFLLIILMLTTIYCNYKLAAPDTTGYHAFE